MEKNNWHEISSDINHVTKKIKNKVANEDIIGDLRESLNSTIESASQVLKNISFTIHNTVSDEEIKNETAEIVSKINKELKNLIDQFGKNNSATSSEEE